MKYEWAANCLINISLAIESTKVQSMAGAISGKWQVGVIRINRKYIYYLRTQETNMICCKPLVYGNCVRACGINIVCVKNYAANNDFELKFCHQ